MFNKAKALAEHQGGKKKFRFKNKLVLGEFLKSRGDRRLIQSATVLLPSVRSKA